MSKNQKNKTLVGSALLASICSIALHGYLTLTHFKLKLGVGGGKSLCNISDHLNCDAVAVSKFASLFSYPLALWAVFTHVVLCFLLLLWFIGLLQDSARILRISTWLSIFIGMMSIIMGVISSVALGTYCLFCIFTYVLSFVIAGCLIAGTGTEIFSQLSSDLKSLVLSQKWVLFVFLLIPAGTIFTSGIIKQELLGADEETLRIAVQESLSKWHLNSTKTFNETQGLIFQADTSPASVTIVEFADFLCPHCKVLAEPMHNFVQAHPGIKLIYKPFPLDGVCNDEKIPKRDGLRCELVYATLCAESLFKKGWGTHAYVFEHQDEWAMTGLDQQLKKMSMELGYDSQQLSECMKKSEIHQLTLDSAKEGSEILGTPTVYVNGRELPEGNIIPILEAAVMSLNP